MDKNGATAAQRYGTVLSWELDLTIELSVVKCLEATFDKG